MDNNVRNYIFGLRLYPHTHLSFNFEARFDYCHLCSVATTTENFSETKVRKKKSKIFGLWENTYHTIFIYGKMLIIEFSYNFLYVWNCMKVYDKKFLIYGNCMIRSFGQPGLS